MCLHLRNSYKEGTDFDIDRLKDILDEEPYIFLEDLLKNTLLGDEETAYKDCIRQLEKKKTERRIKEIEKTLQMLDEMPDDSRAKEDSAKLMKELVELRRKR